MLAITRSRSYDKGSMSPIEIINLLASLASLILSVLAIALALYFYERSKDSEKNTALNVNEIKTQTRALTEISSRMLDKYTDYATGPKAADESFLVVTQLLSQMTSSRITGNPDGGTKAQLERYAVDVSIAALFYAGLTNLAVQDLLPQRLIDIEDGNGLPNVLNFSKEDFDDLWQRLSTVEQDMLTGSAVHNLYQITQGWVETGQIKAILELYTQNPEN